MGLILPGPSAWHGPVRDRFADLISGGTSRGEMLRLTQQGEGGKQIALRAHIARDASGRSAGRRFTSADPPVTCRDPGFADTGALDVWVEGEGLLVVALLL